MDVLPDEPVTPTIVSPPATSSAATAAASLASAASTAAPEPSVSCSSTPAAVSVAAGAWLDHDGGHPDRPRRQHRDRTGGHRGRGEVVAVGPRTGQRQEQPAGSHCARIEFDGAGDARRGGVGGRDVGELTADDVGDLGEGQIDHARDPSASSAPASSSRSSNGRVWPRLV